MGKSTLCRKLTYTWSVGPNNTEGNHLSVSSFDLVFLLRAGSFCDLERSQSIIDIIYDQLLPEDFAVSKSVMKSLLENKQCKSLFIIDGYDEISDRDAQLLDKLIRGNVLSHSVVLVTSRPTHILPMLKHFDSLFVINGYDRHLRKEFVEKFAQEMDLPFDYFSDLLQKTQKDSAFKDICRNPLNLSILCLLLVQQKDMLPTSRAGLYGEMHDFIIKRAQEKLGNITEEELGQKLLQPLYHISFDALDRGLDYLSESDLKKFDCNPEHVCKVGFLTKEVAFGRSFTPVFNYVFTHRSFLEYLAAKHLSQLDKAQRNDYLRDNLGVRRHRGCCKFLFGLLQDDEDSLLDFIKIWFECASYSAADHVSFSILTIFDLFECHKAHILLQSLAELGVSRLSSRVAEAILRSFPTQVCFSFALCTPSCVQGLIMVCDMMEEQMTCYRKLSVVIPAHCFETKSEEFTALAKRLASCKCVSSVGLVNVASMGQLHQSMDLMRVGHPTSYVRHLKLNLSGVVQSGSLDLPAGVFGEVMEGIEIYECMTPDVISCLLRAVSSRHRLSVIKLSQCNVDGKACEIITSLVNKDTLREFSLLDHSLHVVCPREMANLLSKLATCSHLCKLKLSHLPSAESHADNCSEAMRAFGQILRNNPIKRLFLSDCYFTSSLCTVISHNLSFLTTLQRISIHTSQIPDPDAFDSLLSTLCIQPNIALHELDFTNMDPRESHVELIGKMMQASPNLHTLSISKLNSNLIDDITKALLVSPKIQRLTCKKLGFSGEYVAEFASAIEKLPELKELTISVHVGNYLVDQDHLSLLRAIAKCSRLEKLGLHKTGIDDHLVPELCCILTQNPNLVHLDIHHNPITPEALDELASCLEKRPKKLDSLDISDCLLTEASPVVDKLQKHCCYLRINWF